MKRINLKWEENKACKFSGMELRTLHPQFLPRIEIKFIDVSCKVSSFLFLGKLHKKMWNK